MSDNVSTFIFFPDLTITKIGPAGRQKRQGVEIFGFWPRKVVGRNFFQLYLIYLLLSHYALQKKRIKTGGGDINRQPLTLVLRILFSVPQLSLDASWDEPNLKNSTLFCVLLDSASFNLWRNICMFKLTLFSSWFFFYSKSRLQTL